MNLTKLLAYLLIGLILGSGATTYMAYSDLLPGVVRAQTINEDLLRLEEEVRAIEEKLDENGSFYNFTEQWFSTLYSLILEINREVNNIEAKLDKGGAFYNFVDNWFITLYNLTLSLKNVSVNITNVTNVINNINKINVTINNIYTSVTNIYNTVNNVYNYVFNIYDITVEIYDFITIEVYNYLINIYDVTISIYNFITIDIYNTLVLIYNLVINIYDILNNIMIIMINLDFKTQKTVLIHVSEIWEFEDMIRNYYVLITLEGEGAVGGEITRVNVVGIEGEEIFLNPTEEVGLFIVTVVLPPDTPAGQYIMVIESEILLELPDGSIEVFKGETIVDVWV